MQVVSEEVAHLVKTSDPLSALSIRYPVTGVPPSSAGAVHDTVTDSWDKSLTRAFSGAFGASEKIWRNRNNIHEHLFVCFAIRN